MNPELFINSLAGRCIKTLKGYWAFVPNPLPPEIELDWELLRLLSEAEFFLGRLSGMGELLPNPFLLIDPCIRREAVLSSRIENTQAGMDDLFFYETSGSESDRVPDVKEVSNYVSAMQYGLKRMHEFPISNRLICEIHDRLMQGMRGEHATPGQMRKTQNWIGCPGCTLNDATYVPPPVEEMKESFSQLEKYLHSSPKEPPLVQCALMHYQFESIHPFIDGNGRMGRLLITFLLCERGILKLPLLYLSSYFERYRDEYYRHLLAVSQKGEWKGWLEYFLKGVSIQAQESLETAQSLLSLHAGYRNKLSGNRIPGLVNPLIDQLFRNPVISVSQLSKEWKQPFPTVQRAVDYLKKIRILKEFNQQQRNKLYIASELMNILVTDQTRSAPRRIY